MPAGSHAVTLPAGLLTFYCYRFIDRLSGSVLIFDAAGLGLFAVTGATRALAYHLDPIAAALLGMVTGIGGGVMRDILISEIPVVFARIFMPLLHGLALPSW